MNNPENEETLKVKPPKKRIRAKKRKRVKKRTRGNPNQKTGLIGVTKDGNKYRAQIMYGGTQHHLGRFDTKEQGGIAYDRFVVDKSTEEVSYTLNYPKMSDSEREEALKGKEPVQEKRGNPNQKTGLIGVYKRREKYQAELRYGGKRHKLGTFDTKEQAGIAYDRFVVGKSTKEVSYTMNYPNMSDPEREEALKVEPPPKRIRGNPNQKTGLIGVRKMREKYRASIKYHGTQHDLGRFDTKEQAGIAYDRFVVDKSTDWVSFTLNYPNMSNPEREEALKVLVEPPKKKRRGNPNQKTGLIGVRKSGGKYITSINYGGVPHHLGSFDTKEQAGIAYDRFVVDKSTKEVFFTLNYPNMSDPEREEALKVEEPVQEKRGKPNKTTGLIGVSKSGNKYQAQIQFGRKKYNLGSFDTKEQAGIAYDRFVIGKSTDEVSFNLNYPNGPSTSVTN